MPQLMTDWSAMEARVLKKMDQLIAKKMELERQQEVLRDELHRVRVARADSERARAVR